MPRPSPLTVALAGCAALAVAMGVGRFAFTPILPMMQAQGGVSLAAGSWLAAANYFGYLVGALFAGRTSRARTAIRAALLAVAASTAGMALADGMAEWLVLRFAAGVASAWALVHVSSWCLAELAAAGRPRLGGAVFSGVGLGALVAGLGCLALMAAGGDADDAWLALGALSLAVTALLWPVLGVDGTSGASPRTRAAHRWNGGWNGEAALLVACYGAFGFAYIIPATFVPVMAKAVVPDARVFGWAWPAFGLTAAVSTLAVLPLVRRVSYRKVWRLSALAMAVGVASPVVLPGLAGVLAAALLVGGTFVVVTMAGLQEARRIAGDGAPSLMAAMTAAFAAGQIAGPLVVPVLGGFKAALALAAALLVLSALLLPKEKKR